MTTPPVHALGALALGALAALGLSACESTEQESARIGREGQHLIASTGTLQLGRPNPAVRVSDVTLLSGAGRTAVAVRLTSADPRPQVDVPVLINVLGPGRRVLYSNDTGGLEPSLQHMPVLRPGHGEWWVDDQVLAKQTPSAVHVQVGRPATARLSAALPAISATGVQLGQQSGLTVVGGSLVNHSAATAHDVTVFAVALRAGHVTAGGRALVEALPGRATAPFQIFLVGNPAGSTIELTVAPTPAA